MRICRVFPNFQIDLLYTEHYLAKELSKVGYTTTFITSDKYLCSWEKYIINKNKMGYYKYDYFDVHRLGAFFPFEKVIYKNIKYLYKIVFSSGFDIIHLMSVGSFSTIIILFLSYLNGKKSPPILISDHSDARSHNRKGISAELYYSFFKLLLLILKKRIKYVITFSDISVNLLSKRYSIKKNKFYVIPLGYDQDNYFYKPVLKNKEKKFIIGFAGKVSPKKRVDFLIKALNNSEFVDKIKLIVVGVSWEDNYFKKLYDLASKSKLEVEFKPVLNTEDLAKFYNYIDLAVYPGGVSITTIEASGCGTPVIIYESIENLHERVSNGRGKLFKTENEMINNIKHFYNMYIQSSIDNNLISNVTAEKYSWKKIKEKYKQIYNKSIYEK